jgi:hypothetical protein
MAWSAIRRPRVIGAGSSLACHMDRLMVVIIGGR